MKNILTIVMLTISATSFSFEKLSKGDMLNGMGSMLSHQTDLNMIHMEGVFTLLMVRLL